MNVKAALNTLKMLAICAMGGLVLNLVIYGVPVQYLSGALLIAALAMAVKMMYDSEVEKQKHLDNLNNLK